MKKLKITEATAPLADYARDLQGPLVVTAHGRPIAALVPIEDMDMETLAVGTSPVFIEIIERSRRRLETEGGISSAEMRRRLGIKPKSERTSTTADRKMKKIV